MGANGSERERTQVTESELEVGGVEYGDLNAKRDTIRRAAFDIDSFNRRHSLQTLESLERRRHIDVDRVEGNVADARLRDRTGMTDEKEGCNSLIGEVGVERGERGVLRRGDTKVRVADVDVDSTGCVRRTIDGNL